MPSSKYPLDALVRLREGAADSATRELAEAVRAREASEARRAHAARETAHHTARADDVRADESSRLTRGELTVADLARADAWEGRIRAEAEALRAREDAARSAEDEARLVEGDARGALASRKADHDVVVKDKARFVDIARRAQEARDEEGAAEAWRPKRA